ncbi:MAG: glycosyl hydrolase family 32 [Clostridia bacterium]|nr:glycosyl hydrolase family 32 [Clostridia bacterium]
MEKLYNNIILPDEFCEKPSDASNVPYLKTPPEVINVTVGRQLFVDDFLIEKTDLSPVYHKAKKFDGNPILYPQTKWEIAESPVACPKSGGVWYDEEEHIFKMWYEAGWLTNMCYATSKDGIHWERPDLGDGTNLILKYEGYDKERLCDELTYLRPDSTTVFIDYSAPKNEKYKLFLRNPGSRPYGGIVATSGDGINFENFKFTSKVFDRSTIFYNPFRKKWVYSIRKGWPVRVRHYRECDNLFEGAEWNDDEARIWMQCDSLDSAIPYIGYEPQLYNVDCVGYESIMLGMFQIMYGPENDVCEKGGVPKITELIPMYSRDGYHFSRPCRDSIINASMHRGAWDRGYVQSVGGVTLINGDELYIYYIGFGGDESRAEEPWFTNGMYRNGATGLAKLRRDGFVSMNGDGSLLTRPMIYDGKTSMHINFKGNVKVELLDADNNLLASARVSGDSTNMRLFDVSAYNNKVVRARFDVDGELYSFGFADACGDFGGAHAAGIVK